MIRASDLTGCEVRTESGERVGRVHDLRLQADGSGTWRLIGIVVGRRGMFERLGVTSAPRPDPVVYGELIPWRSISRVEEGRITIDSGATRRE